jgi:hypothetical protein
MHSLGLGITITTHWIDEYVFEVGCRCSNGIFSGEAEFHLGANELSEFANLLRGFPSIPNDKRRVALGTIGEWTWGGGIAMEFYCLDSTGHCAVKIELENRTYRRRTEVNFVALHVPVEPGAIDSFLSELAGLKSSQGAVAHLPMAT